MGQYSKFEAVFLTETTKAVLVEIEGEELWVPDSQVGSESEIFVGCKMQRGDVAEIEMADWLARKRGLIE